MGLMTANDILDALYGSYQPKMSLEQWYGKGNNLSPAYGSGYIYATDPVNGIPYAPMSLSEAAASPEHSAELQNIKNLYSQYEAMPSYRTGKGLLSQVIQSNPEKVGVGLGTDTPEAQQIANLIGMDEAGKNLVVYDRYNLGNDNLNTLVNRYKQLNPHMNVTIADEATGKQFDTNKSWMQMTRDSDRNNTFETGWMPYIGGGIKTLAEALLTIVAPPVGAAMVAGDVAMKSGASGNSLGNSLGKGLISGAASYVGGELANAGRADSLFNLNPLAGGWGTAAGIGTKALSGLGNSLIGNDYVPNTPYKAILDNLAKQSASAGTVPLDTGNYATNVYSPTSSTTGLLSSAVNSASGLNTSPVAATSQFNPLDVASTMKTPVDAKDLIAQYLKQYGLVNSAYSADKLTDSLKNFYEYVA